MVLHTIDNKNVYLLLDVGIFQNLYFFSSLFYVFNMNQYFYQSFHFLSFCFFEVQSTCSVTDEVQRGSALLSFMQLAKLLLKVTSG